MKLSEARDFWRSRGVPEEAIEDLWNMAEAARYNDALAEEAAIKTVFYDLGWHQSAIDYMAEQRGMRAVMALGVEGRNALREFARKMDPLVASGVDQQVLSMMTTVWLDGFANCARATKLRSAT